VSRNVRERGPTRRATASDGSRSPCYRFRNEGASQPPGSSARYGQAADEKSSALQQFEAIPFGGRAAPLGAHARDDTVVRNEPLAAAWFGSPLA
jgi:hypothetical protein